MNPQTAAQINAQQTGQLETISGESPAAAYQLAAQVTALKAQLEAARGSNAHLQDALECIERAVDFVPKDEPLSLWVKRVVEERDAAQKACAEMRDLIKRIAVTGDDCGDYSDAEIDHALSTDCGKDFVPRAELAEVQAALHEATIREIELNRQITQLLKVKEQIKPLVEALQLLRSRAGYNELPTIEAALAHAKELL